VRVAYLFGIWYFRFRFLSWRLFGFFSVSFKIRYKPSQLIGRTQLLHKIHSVSFMILTESLIHYRWWNIFLDSYVYCNFYENIWAQFLILRILVPNKVSIAFIRKFLFESFKTRKKTIVNSNEIKNSEMNSFQTNHLQFMSIARIRSCFSIKGNPHKFVWKFDSPSSPTTERSQKVNTEKS